MFLHLTQIIECGEIDNRTPGHVALSLWAIGEKHPLVFHLEGNCLSDIAGCLVQFRLTHEAPESRDALLSALPKRGEDVAPSAGLVGDISASRRTRDAKNRKNVCNSLYLQWFTDEEDAFLIDSAQFEISFISLPEWTMNSCDEQAQIMTNQQVLRDYVLNWISDYSQTPTEKNPLPDHPWDMRLRETEGIALIYQEIHRKYGDHPFGEIAEAFVMGWDSRLDKMANSDETSTAFSSNIRGGLNIFDILNEEEALEVQISMSHPLFQQLMSFTEYLQKMFGKEFEEKTPPYSHILPSILHLFEAVRYITPNILSCLLQINEENADYSRLTLQMERCSGVIEKSLSEIKVSFTKGELEKMLSDLHAGVIAMHQDMAKQMKR